MDFFSKLKDIRSFKSINISGHVYRVEHVDRALIDDNDGLCDADTQILSIASDLTGKQLVRTFLHECRHAYQYETGFALQVLGEQAMEIDAESFASSVISLIDQMAAA